ncbi:MAG: DNA cytosine methyltransferase [Nitriliruptorales bacterium]
MPECDGNGLTSLSLFSGGGGLDLGFKRAGFEHLASYEILQEAADTLTTADPDWLVYGGDDGDVCQVDWREYRGKVAVLHGGPPCQPFSAAGRQRGQHDTRDMFPEFVRAVREAKPAAFVAENVPALVSKKFATYVHDDILEPLSREYEVRQLVLPAEDYGVPQVRRRVIFAGFRDRRSAKRFLPPAATHAPFGGVPSGLPSCPGARQALGLPDIGRDALAPTIRSALTGPRHTTSVISSVSAARKWAEIEIWPNGVAPSREKARAFVAKNGHFRLSTQDCAILQGFPESWPFQGATYMVLGQIGNAVPPTLGYAVARSVADALAGA